MNYTCTIHTDCIDPKKKEEILQRIAKQMTEVLKENAPSGTGIPSGAKQNYSSAL